MDNVMFYDSKKKKHDFNDFPDNILYCFYGYNISVNSIYVRSVLILKSFFHSKTGINRAILRSNFSGCFILLYKCK